MVQQSIKLSWFVWREYNKQVGSFKYWSKRMTRKSKRSEYVLMLFWNFKGQKSSTLWTLCSLTMIFLALFHLTRTTFHLKMRSFGWHFFDTELDTWATCMRKQFLFDIDIEWYIPAGCSWMQNSFVRLNGMNDRWCGSRCGAVCCEKSRSTVNTFPIQCGLIFGGIG